VNISGTPLLIIGAALPRSGTTSTRMALERLGYRVFHATTFSPEMSQLWKEFVKADTTKQETQRKDLMDQFVHQLSEEGFNATLDQPSCFVIEELMNYYADAKVLNTQRESSREWAVSMVSTAYSLDLSMWQPPFDHSPEEYRSPFGRWSKEQLGIALEDVHRDGIWVDVSNDNSVEELQLSSVNIERVERAYDDYQEWVLNTVPKERLVQFRVTDGWEPLCNHFLPESSLISCPKDEPFPRENSKEKGFLREWIKTIQIRVRLYNIHPLLDQHWIVHLIELMSGHVWFSLAAVSTILVSLWLITITWAAAREAKKKHKLE